MPSKCYRRSTSSRISEIVGLFESPPSLSTPRLVTPREEVKPSVSVKKIISRFDGGGTATPTSASQGTSQGTSHATAKDNEPTPPRWKLTRSQTVNSAQRKWIQVEKVIEGRPVARLWLRRSSSSGRLHKDPPTDSKLECFTARCHEPDDELEPSSPSPLTQEEEEDDDDERPSTQYAPTPTIKVPGGNGGAARNTVQVTPSNRAPSNGAPSNGAAGSGVAGSGAAGSGAAGNAVAVGGNVAAYNEATADYICGDYYTQGGKAHHGDVQGDKNRGGEDYAARRYTGADYTSDEYAGPYYGARERASVGNVHSQHRVIHPDVSRSPVVPGSKTFSPHSSDLEYETPRSGMNEGKYDNDERIRARGCDTARRYVAADNCTGDESPELDAGRFRDTRRFEDPDRFADRFTDPVEREGGGVRVSEWADLDVRHEGGVRSTVPFASLTMAERPAVMESVASSMECAARLEDEPKMDRPVSGGSRASHFIAFRIDDPDAVDRFVAFQDAICEQHPFLDIGRTNPQKFHLTLLVLSLRPSEIEVAVQAMNAGIEMFRKRMAQTLNLEFRTVGAFNTRLLFVAPSLRQRLILDALHVDLARACGAHGLTIVGAGAGWTSAMALKHKIQATGVGLSHVKLARPRDGTGAAEEAAQNTMTVNEPCSSVSNDYTPSPEDIKRSSAAATFRETLESSLHSTPLDRSLLKKYDITGYRNTFYVPQVSVFKMGKANRKNKNAKYTPPQLSHTLPI